MSASSQAAGNNTMRCPVTPASSQITAACWVQINAFDKDVYGVFFGLENNSIGTAYREVAFQQDTDGPGTGDVLQALWWNGSGGGSYGSTSAITTSTDIWLFLAIVVNGANVTFYWGFETGSLSSQTLVADYDVGAAMTHVFIGGDLVNEYSDGSFRMIKVWDVAKTGSDLLAERDSPGPSYAVVDATGITNVLPTVDGATVDTATVGSNGTVAGSFADGATDPVIPTPPENNNLALFMVEC